MAPRALLSRDSLDIDAGQGVGFVSPLANVDNDPQVAALHHIGIDLGNPIVAAIVMALFLILCIVALSVVCLCCAYNKSRRMRREAERRCPPTPVARAGSDEETATPPIPLATLPAARTTAGEPCPAYVAALAPTRLSLGHGSRPAVAGAVPGHGR